MAAKTVHPYEIDQLKRGGAAVEIIDVRTPAEYAEVHAEGAQLVPLDRLDPEAVMAARGGGSRLLYVLCRSGSRAAQACERFEAAGLGNVFAVEGGTTAWEKAGLPVVRGVSRVISLERQVRVGAGLLVLVGVLLGATAHPAFYALSAVVGAGLVFAGVTDWCGMGMLLARMPWNRVSGGGAVCSR